MGPLACEVRRLLEAGVPVSAPGMAAIGYRETVALLEGRLSESDWVDTVIRQTRRYAKRQETWFRSEPDLLPIRADAPDLVEEVVSASRPLFS